MASVLSSAGKVGLVTVSFGYVAARLTTSLSRKMDVASTAKSGASEQASEPSPAKQCKVANIDGHVQCLQTTLR